MTLGWRPITAETLPDGTVPDYVIAIDPGEANGWALAQVPWTGEIDGEPNVHRPLSVVANGTAEEKMILRSLMNIRHRLRFVVIEEPPVRGSVWMQQLVGRMLEVLRPALDSGKMELCLIGPSQWKQYPPRKIAEAKDWLCRGDCKADSRHAQDALGMLAYWWIIDAEALKEK
jgi:hypothetical protein